MPSFLWKDFKNFVYTKHGKLHGSLAFELEVALEKHLQDEIADTHINTSDTNNTKTQRHKDTKTQKPSLSTDNDILYSDLIGGNNGRNLSPSLKTLSQIISTAIETYGLTETSQFSPKAFRKMISA